MATVIDITGKIKNEQKFIVYNGKNYKDSDPYTYFLRIKGKHRMHPNTEELLDKLLVMLRDEGEEKTFAYIKTECLGRKKAGKKI